MNPRKIILPAVTGLTFAGSFIAGKYTSVEIRPLSTTLLRYIIASLTLATFIFKYGQASLEIKIPDIWKLVLLGLFGVVGYHFFFFSSLIYTKAANSAIINAMNPLVTGTMAAIFLKERLPGRGYLGVVLAFIGVIILLTRGDIEILRQLQFNIGELLMLLGVLCWVIYMLMIRKMINRYSGFTLTFYAAISGVILLIPLVFLEDFSLKILAMSWPSLVSILYMGIIASGIGYYLFNLSIGEIGPTRTASSVYSLLPIFVAILGLIFFGESVTPVMILSTILIIVGLNLALKESA
jgi:drug/metabolite transporter (DMT)-like permease